MECLGIRHLLVGARYNIKDAMWGDTKNLSVFHNVWWNASTSQVN